MEWKWHFVSFRGGLGSTEMMEEEGEGSFYIHLGWLQPRWRKGAGPSSPQCSMASLQTPTCPCAPSTCPSRKSWDTCQEGPVLLGQPVLGCASCIQGCLFTQWGCLCPWWIGRNRPGSGPEDGHPGGLAELCLLPDPGSGVARGQGQGRFGCFLKNLPAHASWEAGACCLQQTVCIQECFQAVLPGNFHHRRASYAQLWGRGDFLVKWTVITKYHRLRGINKGNLFSHSSGGWEVQDQGASWFNSL